MKKLKTLAKELGFSTEERYFDYCIESFVNGQIQQCKDLFNDMKKDDQERFLAYIKSLVQYGAEYKAREFYFEYAESLKRYKVVKVMRVSERRQILRRGLTREEAKRVVNSYPDSSRSMVVFTEQ